MSVNFGDNFEMTHLDLLSYLNYSEGTKSYIFTISNEFLYPNDISLTELQTSYDISLTQNVDIKRFKRKHDSGKHHHRSNRSSSLGVRHIINDINLTAFSENSARNVTLPPQSPRSFTFVFVPRQHMLLSATSMPLPLTGLHTDLVASCLKLNKRLIYQSNRVARFQSFSPKHVFGTLQCLLASLGQLAPRNPLEAPARISSMFETEPMLECAHCNMLMPFADLARHKPRSAITYTAELLSQVLASQHMEQCSGRLGGEMLYEDDVQMAVAAVSELYLVPSKTIDSFSGMLKFSV